MCQKKIIHNGVLLNADGDFACSESCKNTQKKEKEYFFSTLIYDPERMENWLMGKDKQK